MSFSSMIIFILPVFTYSLIFEEDIVHKVKAPLNVFKLNEEKWYDEESYLLQQPHHLKSFWASWSNSHT